MTDSKRQAGLDKEVAAMICEWERSDELALEFARRLIDYFRAKLLDHSP